MKIAILGFGREGKSLLKFLKKQPQYKTAGFWILDKNPQMISNIKNQVSGTQTGENYLKNLNRFDVIFRSPGIPYEHPKLKKARKLGVEISSATKLFFEKCPAKIVGITGTKGKGTTSTLIYKILKSCGKKTYLVGNIGSPALDILLKLDNKTIVVMELSSFQLQDLKQSPGLAVVLGIAPDHLDVHKNFKEYLGAKTNIAKYQKAGDKIVYDIDNKFSKLIASKSKGQKYPISLRTFRGFDPKILKIPGEHNFKNAAMAYQTSILLGCPKNKVIKTIQEFRGNQYRLQFIKKINGVDYYNDTAATNPWSTIAALKSFSQPVILIAGGTSKNIRFKELGKKAGKIAKAIILFGQNKNEIRKTIKNSSKIKMAQNLNRAVKIASSISNPGDMILFSPASASFDMFKDYADRGRAFDKIIKNLN